MDKIIQLDRGLIEKIAAGEVVERPASVVKELLENALDAKADKITIHIASAGKKQIIVEDNGTGMSPNDARMALMRHSTSKINNIEDLELVSTLGFRGEALASIAAVSKLTLETKERESEGIKIVIEGGQIKKTEKVGLNEGTKITVDDLFYNVPARLKFLKSNTTELNLITDIITRYALINSHIHIIATYNKKEIINAPKTDTLLENISLIYGREISKDLIEVNYKRESILISGYISKPQQNKSTRSYQSIYVNKRYVKTPLIQSAIQKGYTTRIMHDRYPIAVLLIEMNPKTIDVNVHPKKTEIRFSNEKTIYEHVVTAVESALDTKELIPHVHPKAALSDEKFDRLIGKIKKEKRLSQLEFNIGEPEEKKHTDEKLPDFTVKCQVLDTYIIAESLHSVYIIDQHAADERYYYEKLSTDYSNRSIVSQALIDPIHIELKKDDFQFIVENSEFFKDVGFEIEPFGTTSVLLRTIPNVFGKHLDRVFLSDLIDEALNFDKKDKLEDIKDKIIKIMACRAAVKAGDKLSAREMIQLLERLSTSKNPYNCPHGRPTIINLNKREFEKLFKRVV